jgi:hypothetical protein
VRNRNWVLAAVLVVAVLAAGAIFGRSGRSGGVQAPSVRFGATVEPAASSALLNYTNGWVATSGAQAIGIYAGSQAAQRGNGLFVIVRTTKSGQRITRRVLHGAGAVTLLRPSPPANETAAFAETLHFVTASGATGALDLGDDRVTLNR